MAQLTEISIMDIKAAWLKVGVNEINRNFVSKLLFP